MERSFEAGLDSPYAYPLPLSPSFCTFRRLDSDRFIPCRTYEKLGWGIPDGGSSRQSLSFHTVALHCIRKRLTPLLSRACALFVRKCRGCTFRRLASLLLYLFFVRDSDL